MRLDDPYECTDRINPHFTHMIQPLDEGEWHCIDCDGPFCGQCGIEQVSDEEVLCGECLSERASYYLPDEGGSQ